MADEPKLPKRSKRFGVGKEIGGAVYVHRDYIARLPSEVEVALKHIPDDFDFVVVKLTSKTNSVSFIASPDFDTSDEPIVGDSISVSPDGTPTRRRQLKDPWIYHHKWLFVTDDYTGFNIEQSKARSLHWMSLPDIDFRRIGRKSYWISSVETRLDRP